MVWPLRYNTASQEVPLGRFLDPADGDTEKTSLTINNTDIKLFKTGATSLVSKNSGGATHMANGEYYAVFDATDTDTLGPMKVTCHVSGALAVQLLCCVYPQDVYDALVAGSEFLPVDSFKQKWTLTGTTLQPKKPDGTTDTGYSRTVTTNASGEPITGSS